MNTLLTTFCLALWSVTLPVPLHSTNTITNYAPIYIEGEGFFDTYADFSFGEQLQRVDLQFIIAEAVNNLLAQGAVQTSVETLSYVVEEAPQPYVFSTFNDTYVEASPREKVLPALSVRQQEMMQKSLNEMIQSVIFRDDSNVLTPQEEKDIEKLLATTFQKFPDKFYAPLKFLTLKTGKDGPRGLAGNNTMILRVSGMPTSELVGVAVHELGHVVDLGMLIGSGVQGSAFKDGASMIAVDDPSVQFYRISWNNEHEKSSNSDQDFVSGYAMSDAFEDFAETFNYYVLHGVDFIQLAQKNTALAKKYAFMKDIVFEGKEFTDGSSVASLSHTARSWDTTILPYNWKWYTEKSFKD